MVDSVAIGIDLLEVERIHSSIVRYGERFISKIFTDAEAAWCRERAVPSLHFAGRFAAKEAVRKAIFSCGERSGIPFRAVEILRVNDEPPVVTLAPPLDARFRVALSITHTETTAAAVALVFPR